MNGDPNGPVLSGMRVFNVRDFHAIGNGTGKDTAAIQRAIDACAEAGGGTVYCPPGTYLTGTITLKSNVNLHLEAGATLLGSPNRADYMPMFKGNNWTGRFNYDHYLIFAHRAQNVAISGRGAIDGNGHAFFGPLVPGKAWFSIPEWRPGPTVTFVECQDVSVRDVHLLDSPSFGIWPVGCDRVTIHGCTILSNREGPNTDGIQVVCCHGVHISDCYISGGDDCICVYSMSYFLDEVRSCKNVAVTNCVLSTSCNGIRVGASSDWPLRNCTFSNLVMFDTRTGISMLCVPTAHPDQRSWKIDAEQESLHGPIVENISFSHIQMDTRKPIDLWIAENASRPACIRNVSISHVTATADRGCYVGGNPQLPIENLRISDLHLSVKGLMPADTDAHVPDPYPQFDWNTPGLPHALFFRHVHGLALRNVRVEWEDAAGPWRSALRVEQVADLELSGVTASQAPEGQTAPAVHLIDVADATLQGCRATPGTGTFLSIEGDRTAHIAALANDLSRAERAYQVANDTPRGALREAGNLLPA